MLVVATSPHGFVTIFQDEASLSQELRTVRLLQPHVLVGYQWQNTGLRPRFIESQQLRKQPHVATPSEPDVPLSMHPALQYPCLGLLSGFDFRKFKTLSMVP